MPWVPLKSLENTATVYVITVKTPFWDQCIGYCLMQASSHVIQETHQLVRMVFVKNDHLELFYDHFRLEIPCSSYQFGTW